MLESFGRVPWSSMNLDGPGQGQKIKVLWEHLGLRDKNVSSCMTGSSVIVKRIFFNAGPPKKLEQKIRDQASKHIPHDLDDVYLDYQILEQSGKPGTVEVMLVAGKKKVVQELIKVMEHSGLSLKIADVDAFALSNCFEFNYPELAQEPSYLLDIGGNKSIFTIFWNRQPGFFREMSFGGRQLTDIIARSLDIGEMEAEKIKILGPSSQEKLDIPEITKQMYTSIKSWAAEVKRLMEFCRNSLPEVEQPRNIFLSGGGSLFNGIDAVFQEHLGIETRHLDPWKSLQTSINDFDYKYLDSVKPQFAVATGLALRGIV